MIRGQSLSPLPATKFWARRPASTRRLETFRKAIMARLRTSTLDELIGSGRRSRAGSARLFRPAGGDLRRRELTSRLDKKAERRGTLGATRIVEEEAWD
jgi:hypothetical protein